MNLKEIKELIELMNEHALCEIDIEREGMKVSLRKAGSETVTVQQVPVAAPVAAAPAAVPAAAPAAAPAAEAPAEPAVTGNEVISPMVGTFYRAPSPESPPFVEVGQEVEEGQVLCILEAMKLMNELKSEVKGKIVKILVENAQPVEFGQPLFIIEPN